MKTLKLASLTTLLAAAFISTPSAVEAAPKLHRGPAPTRTIKKITKPDLRCSIRVFEDAAGMKPVANGRQLGYGGGAPKLWVQVVIENGGLVNSGATSNAVSIKNNGSTIKSSNDALALPAGLAKIYPLVPVNLPSTTNKLHVSVKTDSTNAAGESNEFNNVCSFSATASVVH